jgi:tRNA(Ile)-lysidine synthase
LKHAFLTYINKNKLFLPHQKILLAVSSGRDSVAMVSLFAESGLDFGIIHCNFQLRGEDSEGDELFAKNLAEKLNIPFFTTRFHTKKEAKKVGVSTQMIARKLRYDWFEKIRIEAKYDFIATAHHLNDAIETVLLNLTKGTGIEGLKGISAKNGKVVRPILFASRNEIDAYIEEKKLDFREDISNESTDYQRNKIRLEVIPILKTINPNLESTFVDTLERLANSAKMVQEKTASYFQNHEFLIEDLQKSETPTLILFENLKQFGFNYKQCVLMTESLDKTASKVFLSKAFKIEKNRKKIVLKPLNDSVLKEIEIPFNPNGIEIESPISLRFEIVESKDLIIAADKNKAYFKLEKLNFPLVLRPWQQGDTMQPYGMNGRKKISDMLINVKLSAEQKSKQMVLISGKEIAWLVSIRASEIYRVGEGKVLIVSGL